MEDIKSANDISMNAKNTDERGVQPMKRPPRPSKYPPQKIPRRRRKKFDNNVRSVSPEQRMAQSDYSSPYNELLYKRYREYRPNESVIL